MSVMEVLKMDYWEYLGWLAFFQIKLEEIEEAKGRSKR